jgi:radical SAM protein with 4Fe4S-binding SPASM domain
MQSHLGQISNEKKRMKQFKKVYIEITNKCNLKCSFCPPGKRKAEFMTVEFFSKILDEIKPFTGYIYLHVKGEPFLHNKISEILDISHKKGFKVNITTNSTLIHDVHEKIISKPALRQLNFSLHCFDDESSGINKNEYMKNVLLFTKEALKKTNIIISLRFWNLDLSNNQPEENRKKFELLEEEFQLPYKLEEKIITGKGFKIAERLYLNSDFQFIWPDLNDENDNSAGSCRGLRDHVAILSDGTVVPCCLDAEGVINLGNIFSQNFNEIISSKRSKDISEGFLSNKAVELLCRKCRFKEKFQKSSFLFSDQ